MNQAKQPEIDADLVKHLITMQFPQWKNHEIRPVDSAGTDNAIYRLGEEMAVRLPRVEWAVGQVQKEQQWLPGFVSLLPLPVPAPLAMGTPSEGYPWHWSISRWLKGEDATIEPIGNPLQAATTMAQFVVSMQRIDSTGGPAPGPHNSNRGVPLAMRDAAVRHAIKALDNFLDGESLHRVWEAALRAPVWQGKPVWLHGDLHPGNVLVSQGQLSAVIDFGTMGVGDPACDLMVAWTLLTAEGREVFREALSTDDDTWTRGRGWALSFGLLAYAYYMDTNPILATISRRTIVEALKDV